MTTVPVNLTVMVRKSLSTTVIGPIVMIGNSQFGPTRWPPPPKKGTKAGRPGRLGRPGLGAGEGAGLLSL